MFPLPRMRLLFHLQHLYICLYLICQLFHHISIFNNLHSNVQKVVSMAQGLLGPLMYCLMPRKSFLCKFGIDFAFYNLARCLAWPGSWLNIFGLKTGRGEQAWSGGRIPIGFISLQRVTQGVALAGTGQTFTIILLDKASAAPEHSKIFFSGLHLA